MQGKNLYPNHAYLRGHILTPCVSVNKCVYFVRMKKKKQPKKSINEYWQSYNFKYGNLRKVKSKYRNLDNSESSPENGAVKVVKGNRVPEMYDPNSEYYFLRGLPIVSNSHFGTYPNYCRSDYFKRLRAEVLRLADGKCYRCKKTAQTAHHIRYNRLWAETKLSDCRAVCHKCHTKIHLKPNTKKVFKPKRSKRLATPTVPILGITSMCEEYRQWENYAMQ